MGVLDPPKCIYCSKLSLAERRRRRDYFLEPVALADALVFCNATPVEPEGDEEGRETDEDDDVTLHGALPDLRVEVENALSARSRGTSGASSCDSLSTTGTSSTTGLVRSLRQDFPWLIGSAAKRLRVAIPVVTVSTDVDRMTTGVYSSRERATESMAPVMPSIDRYIEGSWGAPADAKAPVSCYMPFCRVPDRLGAIKSGMPPLEAALAANLTPSTTPLVTKTPVLPTPRDRTSSALNQRTFVLAAQAAAVSNNVALLAASMAEMAQGKEELTPEEVSEVARASAAVLHLTQAQAACAGQIMGASVVHQRHLWLALTTLKDAEKTPLLNAPISTEGLFGDAVAEASERLTKLEEQRKAMKILLPMAARRPAGAAAAATGSREAKRPTPSAQRRERRIAAEKRTQQVAAPPSTPLPVRERSLDSQLRSQPLPRAAGTFVPAPVPAPRRKRQ